MKYQNQIDEAIAHTLHSFADGMQADAALDKRVKFAVRSSACVRHIRHSWRRAAVVAAAVLAVAVTGAFASGKVAGLISVHSANNQSYTEFADTAQGAKLVADNVKRVEAFSSGYQFDDAYVETTAMIDDSGKKIGEYPSITIDYLDNEGNSLTFTAHKKQMVDDQDDIFAPEAVIDENGVTLTYHNTAYLDVPVDYQLTDEERQAMNNNELCVNVGTDQVEKSQLQSVKWVDDGVAYLIFGRDTGMTGEDFFNMAREVMAAS